MFREMRRKRQALSQEEAVAILERGTSGVLALLGDDDYPYAVPISYVFQDGKLYFHGAQQGHKIDAIKKCNKVSFCVIDQDQVVPEELTTYFRSVIVFGQIRIVADEQERTNYLTALSMKYNPCEDAFKSEIEKDLRHTTVLELSPEHISAKEAIELVRG